MNNSFAAESSTSVNVTDYLDNYDSWMRDPSFESWDAFTETKSFDDDTDFSTDAIPPKEGEQLADAFASLNPHKKDAENTSTTFPIVGSDSMVEMTPIILCHSAGQAQRVQARVTEENLLRLNKKKKDNLPSKKSGPPPIL